MSEPHRPDTDGSAESCDRLNCSEQATVLLLFDPRLTQAWLCDLDGSSRTVGISLCLAHANGVTVPSGWTLTDQRGADNRVTGGAPVSQQADDEGLAPVRLASVTPIASDPSPAVDDADEELVDEDSTLSDAAEAADEQADADEEVDDDEAVDDDDSPADADGVLDRPTLWADDEPEGLRVDPSTPLLSRAFRASHID